MDPIVRTPAVSEVRRRLTRHRHADTPSPSSSNGQQSASAVTSVALDAGVPPVIVHAQDAQHTEQSATKHSAQNAVQHAAQQAESDQKAKQQVEQELAAIKTQAERRGFLAGQERGEDLAKKAVSEQLERLASISASLNQARESVLEDAEAIAVEVVYTAVCRIIGDVAVTRDAVAGMVGQLLRSFQQNDGLIVYLNPQDIELMQSTDEPQIAEIVAQCQLRADSTIQLGGCIVEGDSGTLDARLEVQFARLQETLLAVRNNRESSGESI